MLKSHSGKERDVDVLGEGCSGSVNGWKEEQINAMSVPGLGDKHFHSEANLPQALASTETVTEKGRSATKR